jgi:DNA-binding transcriptional MerR regulator
MEGSRLNKTPGLTSAELLEHARITARQLTYWVEQGFLHPAGNGGSGNPRAWPEAEVDIARRMGRLAGAGLPLEWSAQFARNSWPSGEIAPGITVTVSEEPP